MAAQMTNDSVAGFLDCEPLAREGNSTFHAGMNVTNSTCSNTSAVFKTHSPRQKDMDSTVRILLYSFIFLLSVLGNLLIIVVLALNKRMRTVTNCFLLSLALSDLMMAVFCMPFTLIPNILEDFTFGAAMCKTVTYFMGISVSISTFSLVAIAFERYSAICNPLKSRAWQTRSHAYRVIAGTWLLSLVVMVPYPVFSELKTFPKPNGTLGHMCRLAWPSGEVEQAWYMLLLTILFFIPGVVMTIAYGLISRELYRGMQFEPQQNPQARQNQQNQQSMGRTNGVTHSASAGRRDNQDEEDEDGCYVQVSSSSSRPPPGVELPTLSGPAHPASQRPRPAAVAAGSAASEAKLQAKRRVIRMLLVIVALFFLCWMPLYTANTWRAFAPRSAAAALSGAPISFIHLLSYSSACVNPVIYCFMNGRFRSALLATFSSCCCCCLLGGRGRGRRGRGGAACPWWGWGRRGRDGGKEGGLIATSMGASISRMSYTMVSTAGPC